MMESFWGRMQTELLNRKKWKTRISWMMPPAEHSGTYIPVSLA